MDVLRVGQPRDPLEVGVTAEARSRLRSQEHQEDSIYQQYGREPLVPAGDRPGTTGGRLDLRWVQSKVGCRQHHSPDRNGDERPQYEGIELQVRDDRTDPLGEDR